MEDYSILQEYADVFLEEIPGFPPKWDTNFTVNLMPSVALVFKLPYRFSTPKLIEL